MNIERRKDTNASASVWLEDNEHSDITSESSAMLSHFTNYSSNTLASMESLKITQINRYYISNMALCI